MNDLLLLTIMSIIAPLFASVYIFIRNRMQKFANLDLSKTFYTRKRVIITISLYLIIFVVTFLYACLLIYAILNRHHPIHLAWLELISIMMFGVSFMASCFGGGLYISSILDEEFTKSNLTKSRDYSVLEKEIKLIHGPVSHVVMFTGGIYSMFFICLLEVINPIYGLTRFSDMIYAFYGLCFGIVYVIAHNYSKVWRPQIPFVLITLGIYITFIINGLVIFATMPLNLFFFVFLSVLSAGLVLLFFTKGKVGK